ncbi:ABC transporter ATP-binding protein [Desulfosarcina ovata]|uniref:ABC transporter ATP-binding protein n=1 Tax=Desulfosarcina ovata subsp. ovata TaxID=2752305 RepID=A0A5K8AF21_9BACT|nr:ABC transporter ATP-binding protein [Desulfosarcina ovata]BBO91303.1 ABC transporter ATP-binding protein [Desulfosarcina ovata subsp. ovata]
MLCIEGLCFHYNKTAILENIGIDLHRGQMLSIVGPNGTGKTTLLKCIAGIATPRSGKILIDGVDMSRMSRMDHAKRIGYVPQSSPGKFPITVFDAVLMGRRPYMTWRPSEKDLEAVANVLKSLNLENIALRDFDQLSGGQKQKVLLARAVAQETDYLLMDEPTSNLDLKHQMEVLEMVSGMVKKSGVAAMLAMHDLNLAARFSDRIVMLNKGRIFCSGRPRQVMTAQNIRSIYGVEATINETNGHPHILPIRPVSALG